MLFVKLNNWLKEDVCVCVCACVCVRVCIHVCVCVCVCMTTCFHEQFMIAITLSFLFVC